MSAHTPGPWQYKPNSDQIIAPMVVYLADDGACGDNDCCGQPTYWVEIRPEDGRLIAAAPDLLEALIVVEQCGDPVKVSLYDEEGIDGWRWSHPDGREWEEIGDWSDPPPLHPLSQAAIAKATGAAA